MEGDKPTRVAKEIQLLGTIFLQRSQTQLVLIAGRQR